MTCVFLFLEILSLRILGSFGWQSFHLQFQLLPKAEFHDWFFLFPLLEISWFLTVLIPFSWILPKINFLLFPSIWFCGFNLFISLQQNYSFNLIQGPWIRKKPQNLHISWFNSKFGVFIRLSSFTIKHSSIAGSDFDHFGSLLVLNNSKFPVFSELRLDSSWGLLFGISLLHRTRFLAVLDSNNSLISRVVRVDYRKYFLALPQLARLSWLLYCICFKVACCWLNPVQIRFQRFTWKSLHSSGFEKCLAR